MPRPLLIILFLLLLAISSVGISKGSFHSRQTGPRVVLWAWERPEDLTFIDSNTTGIAFLAGTIRIKDNSTVIIVARRQPLLVSKHSSLVAVVRIEPDRMSHLSLSPKVRSNVAAAIVQLADSFKAKHLQIDFDARVSERIFYRELLKDLRMRLPNNIALTMTALASWCTHDTWIKDLPVDEAVPMLFRMGPEGKQIVQDIERNGDFKEPLCRSSVGISTDELSVKIPFEKRLYVFSPSKWTKNQVEQLMRGVGRW